MKFHMSYHLMLDFCEIPYEISKEMTVGNFIWMAFSSVLVVVWAVQDTVSGLMGFLPDA